MLMFLILLFVWTPVSASPKEDVSHIRVVCEYGEHQLVLLTDRVQLDGEDHLVVDKVRSSWTETQQDSELQQVVEKCEQLIRQLRKPDSSAGSCVYSVVVTVLAVLVLVVFVLLSFIMFKRNTAPVGGVLGSIIPYTFVTAPERLTEKQQ